jgi:hypothetical protein
MDTVLGMREIIPLRRLRLQDFWLGYFFDRGEMIDRRATVIHSQSDKIFFARLLGCLARSAHPSTLRKIAMRPLIEPVENKTADDPGQMSLRQWARSSPAGGTRGLSDFYAVLVRQQRMGRDVRLGRKGAPSTSTKSTTRSRRIAGDRSVSTHTTYPRHCCCVYSGEI